MIRPSTVGNAKLGDGVLTESRPTGPTCPDSCPLKATLDRLQANREGARIPLCYSHDISTRRASVGRAMVDRFNAWRGDRAEWRAVRLKEWTKATAAGKPVRFNVHGDILEWQNEKENDPQRNSAANSSTPLVGRPHSQSSALPPRSRHADSTSGMRVDRAWLADIIVTARKVPGFRGWIYTHAWRELRDSTRRAMVRVGIIVWASVHNAEEAGAAAAKGFRVALISPRKKKGYRGPKAYRYKTGAGRPAIVCPEQIGTKASCEACGFCFNKASGPDLVLLTH